MTDDTADGVAYDRRSFLAAAAVGAAGIAGCTGSSDDGGSDDGNATADGGNETTTASDEGDERTQNAESEESEDGGDEAESQAENDPEASFDEAWPMHRADGQNRGAAGTTGPWYDPASTQETTERWHTTSGWTTPTVADGMVIVGDEGRLYAFDEESGERVWDAITDANVSGTPAYRDGTVYAGDRRGTVYAFDAASGDELWRTETDMGDVTAGLTPVDDAVVAVGSPTFGATIAAFDAEGGAHRWTAEASRPNPVAVADGTVYAVDGALIGIDLESGERRTVLEHPGGDEFETGTVAADGTVYVGDVDTLYAVDPAAGELQWEFRTGGLSAVPAVDGDTLYVADNDMFCYALDAASGEEQWRVSFDSSREIEVAPVVGDRAVYLGTNASSGDSFFIVDPEEETMLETGELPRAGGADSVAVANGRLYATLSHFSIDDGVYAFGAVQNEDGDGSNGE